MLDGHLPPIFWTKLYRNHIGTVLKRFGYSELILGPFVKMTNLGVDPLTEGETIKRSWLLEYLQKDNLLQLEGHAFTFGGTEGSMLVRRGWFDAVSKGMVRCQIEGNGLMLVQRGWFDYWFNSGSKVQIFQCLVEGYDLLLSQKVWFEAG